MLILKLDLPEAQVNYNSVGVLTSNPVPYTPDKVKATRMDLEITGYQAPDAFFAFRLVAKNHPLTLSEQYTMLKQLGFKTVPVYISTPGAINNNELIRIKERYAEYKPVWWNPTQSAEYKLPEVTTITDVAWGVDPNGRITQYLETNLGVFDVIDHRYIEYFQKGLRIKVQNGQVMPYESGPILEMLPTHCPKCNNPVKSFQVSGDLPLILKCVNPVCKLLRTTPDKLPPEVEEPVEELVEQTAEVTEPEPEVSETQVEDSVVETTTQEAEPESVESDSEVGEPTKCVAVVNLEAEVPESLKPYVLEIGADDVVPDGMAFLGILTKSKRSVTRASRGLHNERGYKLVTVEDIEQFLNGKEVSK